MVTFAQAQERAEEWINGDVPGYQHREVRVREFELGFVVWAEDRAEGPRSDGGAQRLVIAARQRRGHAVAVAAGGRGDPPVRGGVRAAGRVAGSGARAAGAGRPQSDVVPVDALRSGSRRRRTGWAFRIDGRIVRRGVGHRLASSVRGSGTGLRTGRRRGRVRAAGCRRQRRGAARRFRRSRAWWAWAEGRFPDVARPGGRRGVSAPGGGTSWPASAGRPRAVPGRPPTRRRGPGPTPTRRRATTVRCALPATVYAPPIGRRGRGRRRRPSEPDAAPEARTRLISGGSQLPSTTVAPALGDPNPLSFPQGPGAGSGPRRSGGLASRRAGPPPPGHRRVRLPAGSRRAGTPPPGAPSDYGYPQGPGAPPAPSVAAGRRVRSPPGAPSSYGYPQGPGASTPPPGAAPSYAASGRPVGRVLPRTAVPQGAPQGPGRRSPPRRRPVRARPGGRSPPGAGDIADAATSKAQGPPRGARGGGAPTPPPPGAPGTPGARPSGPGVRSRYAGARAVLRTDAARLAARPRRARAPPAPGGTPPGGVHHAATMLAAPSRWPQRRPCRPTRTAARGRPSPRSRPGARCGCPASRPARPAHRVLRAPPDTPGGTPPGGVHHAATMLAQSAVRPVPARRASGAPALRCPGAPASRCARGSRWRCPSRRDDAGRSR